MTITLAYWLVGGAVVLLVMLLVVMLIARSLEAKTAPHASTHIPAAHSPTPPHAATSSDTAAATAFKAMFASSLTERLAAARGLSNAAAATQAGKTVGKRVGIGVAAAISSIFIGGVIAGFADGKKVDLASMTPVEISAGDLHGTLLSPRARAPVVLIVPGSGPTDRDGNNPMGMKTDAYKLLAQGLAEQGIATVRVDKRGMFGSAAAGDPNAVSVDVYANDYRAWIDAIRAQTGRKCVWLLGHSEGALMVSA